MPIASEGKLCHCMTRSSTAKAVGFSISRNSDGQPRGTNSVTSSGVRLAVRNHTFALTTFP